jgi:cell division protein ZapA
MGSRAVDLTVAGTSCRVVTTADDAELAQLTAMVEARLASVLKAGRPVTKQAMLLAAIALAHEVREERARADALAARARDAFGALLRRVDEVLAASDDLALERAGDAQQEAHGAARDEDPGASNGAPEERGRRPLPGAAIERLRDVSHVGTKRVRPLEKERGSD